MSDLTAAGGYRGANPVLLSKLGCRLMPSWAANLAYDGRPAPYYSREIVLRDECGYFWSWPVDPELSAELHGLPVQITRKNS